jgi:hypothetical protein
VAVSPVFWIVAALAIRTRSGALALLLVAALFGGVTRIPQLSFVRHIPLLRGRFGGLMTSHLRGMFSVLDTWLAVLLSVAAALYRFTSHLPDAEALPILALLIALALSTQAQALFGLDPGSGVTLCRMLPLKGWEILLAKDIAWMAVLMVLIAPLSVMSAFTFGLAALAIGHHSSVVMRLPQKRWRFAGGRLLPAGALQVFVSVALGFSEMRRSPAAFFVAAGLYAISLFIYGRLTPWRDS